MEREMVIRVDDKVAGSTAMPGFVQKFSKTPSCAASAPLLGEDTYDILIAGGYTDEEILKMEEKNIIYTGRCEK